jgi:hypothetical protein
MVAMTGYSKGSKPWVYGYKLLSNLSDVTDDVCIGEKSNWI